MKKKYDFIEKRDKLVEEKLLRCDDLGDLRVYSYINWCKTWDDITLNSRGVIYNRKTGEVVAQPFPKFFNINQRKDTQERNLPWHGNLRIFKKEDGWLGILYRYNGENRIATRGSFKSIGALWGTEFIKRYDLIELPDEVTLLFELICPATHIVVDYGTREDLVLLAAYNRHTGEEYDWEQIEAWSKQFGFTLVESYDKHWLGYCRGRIKTVDSDQLEGFVIRFENGMRVKIKSEDYFRRSHLLMGLTPLNIWATMVNGKVPKELWGYIDKEYHNILDKVSKTLESMYFNIRQEINNQFISIADQNDRSEFAKRAKKMSHKQAMFARLDGSEKRVDDYVMKVIRPNKNILVD